MPEKPIGGQDHGEEMMADRSAYSAHALWYDQAQRASIRLEQVAALGEGEVTVETRFSLISRGTERLVFNGAVPESEWLRMRAPMQAGDFPFPVKYGYANCGQIVDGPPGWLGKTIFALHPHQTRYNAPMGAVTPVPEGVPARRAVLGANMETALNALWDSGAGPGERIVVVGGGVVGLLVAALAARLPGTEVYLADVLPQRRRPSEALGARFVSPDQAPRDADVVFHASASPEGLKTAIDCCGDEANLVELSWYGDKLIEVSLGGTFHARRLKLLSSQVGQVAASRRARFTHQRRLAAALKLLADPAFDVLLDTEIAFEELPAALQGLFAPNSTGLTALVRYA